MKIAVVSHTYIVDLNRQKWRILAKLHPEIEVMIIVPRLWKPGGVQNRVIESELMIEGNFRVVPVSNFSQNNQGLLTFGFDVIKVLRSFQPQIIQVEQGVKSLAYMEFILLNKLLNLGAKNLFFTWWNIPYDLKFPVSWLESYNLKNTDGIIAGNQDAVEILRGRGYDGKIRVIPQLGIDINEEKRLMRDGLKEDLKERLGIGANDFVVGFVGRFVREKGLLTLARALVNIQDREWRWLLVGRGELEQELRGLAEKWGIDNRLVWVGSVGHEEVDQYINVMNTLVLPSETSVSFKTLTGVGWKEQFGHVLIEAMACQVPVIGSNSGEIPYVIGDSGLVFSEGDVVELTNCLLRLMNDESLARDLGEKGYQRAIDFYTNRALGEQLLEFYRELI